MQKKSPDFLRHSRSMAWQPLIEDGVDTSGLHIKHLRHDDEAGRAPTILLKLEPGASYPYHTHPAGEEIYVIEGTVRVGERQMAEGDYLYTPPDYAHDVHSETGCTLLAVIPEAVQIVPREI